MYVSLLACSLALVHYFTVTVPFQWWFWEYATWESSSSVPRPFPTSWTAYLQHNIQLQLGTGEQGACISKNLCIIRGEWERGASLLAQFAKLLFHHSYTFCAPLYSLLRSRTHLFLSAWSFPRELTTVSTLRAPSLLQLKPTTTCWIFWPRSRTFVDKLRNMPHPVCVIYRYCAFLCYW